jgi:antitoxin YefM
MRTEPLAVAKTQLSALVDEVHRTHERITITRNGEPVVVLIDVGDLESLEETLEIMSDPELVAELDEGHREVEEATRTGDWSGFATLEDIRADLAARRQRA